MKTSPCPPLRDLFHAAIVGTILVTGAYIAAPLAALFRSLGLGRRSGPRDPR